MHVKTDRKIIVAACLKLPNNYDNLGGPYLQKFPNFFMAQHCSKNAY